MTVYKGINNAIAAALYMYNVPHAWRLVLSFFAQDVPFGEGDLLELDGRLYKVEKVKTEARDSGTYVTLEAIANDN